MLGGLLERPGRPRLRPQVPLARLDAELPIFCSKVLTAAGPTVTGIQAAQLAREGMTGAPEIFEHPRKGPVLAGWIGGFVVGVVLRVMAIQLGQGAPASAAAMSATRSAL